MSMIEKLKKLFTKPSQLITDEMLFKGCETGDVALVKKALKLGADVNATKKVGEYWDGIGGRNNPSWEGTIEVTPLIYAATNAFGKEDEKSYKEIIRLLAEKGVDTNRVIAGKEKYWEDDQWELEGDAPDKQGPYATSLEKVLRERAKRKRSRFNDQYEYCVMSDSMASYVAGMFDMADRKGLNKLENKETFLNDASAEVRKAREDAVAKAAADGKPMTADEAIKWHNAEAKKRLEANNLRMKLRQGKSR